MAGLSPYRAGPPLPPSAPVASDHTRPPATMGGPFPSSPEGATHAIENFGAAAVPLRASATVPDGQGT